MAIALLDTNAVSDLMRDLPQLQSSVGKHSDPVVTSVIVVGEIRFGLNRMPAGKKRSDLEARAQRILAAVRIDPITELIADVYGRINASLESQGLNLDDNDMWIAATAVTGGYFVVTRDHAFTRIPGLQVADWSL